MTVLFKKTLGLPWWLSGKEFTSQCRRCGFDPWSGEIPRAMEQLSFCATMTGPVLGARELPLLKAKCPRARAPRQERPPVSEAWALQLEKSPRGSADPAQPNHTQIKATGKKEDVQSTEAVSYLSASTSWIFF